MVTDAFHPGEEVQAWSDDDGQWYPGKIQSINDDGTFKVAWDDPDGGPETIDVSAKMMKKAPIRVENLHRGDKFTGIVTSVSDFGAFVDFGAEIDGLVHISRLSSDRIQNIYDYVKEGQEVEVRVHEVKSSDKVALSMLDSEWGRTEKSDFEAFKGISSSEWLSGTVLRLTKTEAAMVRVKSPSGAEATGLLHVSQLNTSRFVDEIADELQPGDQIKVRSWRLEPDKGKMALTMKDSPRPGRVSDLTPFEGLSDQKWIPGKVDGILKRGALVTVTLDSGPSAQGFLHISQLRDGYVDRVEDELTIGQEIQVRVTKMDSVNSKMFLSKV